MTYFHCAPIPLDVGSVIRPGNWGRVFQTYEYGPNQQVNINAVREAFIELARQFHAPQKPSRLNCIFAVPTLEAATVFRDRHQKTSLIYEVEPLDADPIIHIGDYEKVIAAWPQRYFQAMMDFGRDYWLDQNPQIPEILLPCPIRIVALC